MDERCLNRESYDQKRRRLDLTSSEAETVEPRDTEGVLITDGHHRQYHHRGKTSHDLQDSDELDAAVGGKCSQASQVDGMEAKNSGFKFSSELSLESIRRMQAQFVDERNWNQFHTPRNLLLAMIGEVGEVSELFQWKNEVPVGLTDWSESERTHLSEELSDVLIYLVRLAEQCNVDLPSAVLRKMDLNRHKYPAERVYGSSKKYNEYNDEGNKTETNGTS